MTRSRHRREHEIQKAIAHFLREHWPDMPFVGSVNGAFLGGGRLGAIRWNALRTTGSSSGYPDVFVHWRGAFNEIGLAVEVKVPGARLQPRQQEWRTRLVRAGAVFVVVHSLDEFVQALNSYLGDTPAPAAESDNSADSMQRADEALDEVAAEAEEFEYGAWGTWGYDYSSAPAAPANAVEAHLRLRYLSRARLRPLALPACIYSIDQAACLLQPGPGGWVVCMYQSTTRAFRN